MKYRYEDLHPNQFEELVILICFELLGMSVQAFSTGPDGGRDGRFNGKAQKVPSTTAPWQGKVIIQAKHTNGYNKSFSDSEFFSLTNKSCTIITEIPRITKLKEAGDL